MSWASVHFFIGASGGLIISLFLSNYIENIFDYRLLISTVAGLFALTPDITKILSLFFPNTSNLIEPILTSKYVSNVFFFHGLLDSNYIRDLKVESLAISILVFLFVLAIISYRIHFISSD